MQKFKKNGRHVTTVLAFGIALATVLAVVVMV
jgi:hypothetical protein